MVNAERFFNGLGKFPDTVQDCPAKAVAGQVAEEAFHHVEPEPALSAAEWEALVGVKGK